jgi:hypothetical protein
MPPDQLRIQKESRTNLPSTSSCLRGGTQIFVKTSLNWSRSLGSKHPGGICVVRLYRLSWAKQWGLKSSIRTSLTTSTKKCIPPDRLRRPDESAFHVVFVVSPEADGDGGGGGVGGGSGGSVARRYGGSITLLVKSVGSLGRRGTSRMQLRELVMEKVVCLCKWVSSRTSPGLDSA